MPDIDASIAKVVIDWEGPGSHFAQNVTYWQHATLGTPDFWTAADGEALLATWAAYEDATGGFSACVNNAWTMSRLSLFGPVETPLLEIVQDVGVAGLQSGDPAAPGVCTLVRLRGLGPSRHARGRMYLPSSGEAHVDGAGNMTSAHADGLRSNIEGLYGELGSEDPGMKQVVLSREANGEPLTPPEYYGGGAIWDELQVSVDTQTATQRRRLRR